MALDEHFSSVVADTFGFFMPCNITAVRRTPQRCLILFLRLIKMYHGVVIGFYLNAVSIYLMVKNMISTPLMIENPVKRPKVPPIRPRAASVVTLSQQPHSW